MNDVSARTPMLAIDLDMRDRIILRLLQENGRITNAELGCVDKLDSQIGGILIQGSFGRSCRDPWIDERSGMVLS